MLSNEVFEISLSRHAKKCISTVNNLCSINHCLLDTYPCINDIFKDLPLKRCFVLRNRLLLLEGGPHFKNIRIRSVTSKLEFLTFLECPFDGMFL